MNDSENEAHLGAEAKLTNAMTIGIVLIACFGFRIALGGVEATDRVQC